jgi:hypothetical protein
MTKYYKTIFFSICICLYNIRVKGIRITKGFEFRGLMQRVFIDLGLCFQDWLGLL